MDEHEENLRDALRDELAFERPCPLTNEAGERCEFTLHLTGGCSWETR